jgi:hypothetical protein
MPGGAATLRRVFLIVDKEHRRIVEDGFETREEAEKRLSALIEAEPEAEASWL